MRWAGRQPASGAAGALFMGLTMGIVAAPCVGPIVVGLLVFVGSRQDPVARVPAVLRLWRSAWALPYLVLAMAAGSIEEPAALRRVAGVDRAPVRLHPALPRRVLPRAAAAGAVRKHWLLPAAHRRCGDLSRLHRPRRPRAALLSRRSRPAVGVAHAGRCAAWLIRRSRRRAGDRLGAGRAAGPDGRAQPASGRC